MPITFERLVALVAQIMNKPELANSLKEDDNIVAALRIEPLQTISLFLHVEEEFNIELNYEAMDYQQLTLRQFLKSINDVAA